MSDVKRQFLEVCDALTKAKVEHETNIRATHGRFNVFTTLLPAHDEQRLHSRFIFELLNPNGCHDCDTLFLDLFFDVLDDFPPEREGDTEAKPRDWRGYKGCKFMHGRTEHPIPREVSSGNIDIYLEFDGLCIAIENKIWAADQDKQLERYAIYLESRKMSPTTQSRPGALLYLTLNGRTTTSGSGREYFRISYRDHIRKWLTRCLRETYRIVNVNQVIQQYLQVVENLTQTSESVRSMDEIIKLIKERPEVIRYGNKFQNALIELRKQSIERFFLCLIQILKERGFEAQLRESMPNGLRNDPFASIEIKQQEESDRLLAKVFFQVENSPSDMCNLYIGIEAGFRKKNFLPDEQKLIQTAFILSSTNNAANSLNLQNTNPSFRGSQWPLGRYNLRGRAFPDQKKFMDLDYPDEIINTISQEGMTSYAQEVADDIQAYLAYIRELLAKARTQVAQV